MSAPKIGLSISGKANMHVSTIDSVIMDVSIVSVVKLDIPILGTTTMHVSMVG